MLIYVSSPCSICFSHSKRTNYKQYKCRDEKAHPEHKKEQPRSSSQKRRMQHENIQTNWTWCFPFLPSLHFSVDIHTLLQNSYQTRQLISITYHKERYLELTKQVLCFSIGLTADAQGRAFRPPITFDQRSGEPEESLLYKFLQTLHIDIKQMLLT